ncbi:MAG: TetR/AcrR family transcriptional regulator [Deltaproteobacteria bacterium]|nr:TetR/AcrR family transcriptional regulator [Deltaproteobacteria bacterium]MBW2360983.1 TetR/AcrR family transcriptional regulator [Deltaproteobacteria bacterium]
MTADLQELPRRERRKLEMRGRIVAAAAELFNARGVEATTVVEICERADIAKKTFFNHFPSKQHAVRELACLAIDQLLVEIETARKRECCARDRLRHVFDQVVKNTAQVGPMSRELAKECIHSLQGLGNEPRQTQRLRNAFASIVRDGLASGDVARRHDPETLAEIILGSYYTLILNWVQFDGYPIDRKAREIADFLSDALALAPQTGSR